MNFPVTRLAWPALSSFRSALVLTFSKSRNVIVIQIFIIQALFPSLDRSKPSIGESMDMMNPKVTKVSQREKKMWKCDQKENLAQDGKM